MMQTAQFDRAEEHARPGIGLDIGPGDAQAVDQSVTPHEAHVVRAMSAEQPDLFDHGDVEAGRMESAA